MSIMRMSVCLRAQPARLHALDRHEAWVVLALPRRRPVDAVCRVDDRVGTARLVGGGGAVERAGVQHFYRLVGGYTVREPRRREVVRSAAAVRGIHRIHRVEGLSPEGFTGFTGWRGCRQRDSQDSQGGGAVTRGIHRIHKAKELSPEGFTGFIWRQRDSQAQPPTLAWAPDRVCGSGGRDGRDPTGLYLAAISLDLAAI